MKNSFRWTRKRIARLGRESDRALAASLAIRPGKVRQKRAQLGIPNHSVMRWAPENLAKLGREPDRMIAKSLGITVAAVGIRRRMLGIAPPTCQFGESGSSKT